MTSTASQSEVPQKVETDYVGFSTLPDQLKMNAIRKGFEFTLMVSGETGLGKSTLVNNLLLRDLYNDRVPTDATEKIQTTVSITKKTIDIEEMGVQLRLNIIDTPGFGDALNNKDSWKHLSNFIDHQLELYLRDETSLDRKNMRDNRVHCCLYFISPSGHGLKPLDVECMKALQTKVNIVPVLAKADSYTQDEIKAKKDTICRELQEHNIEIYKPVSTNMDRGVVCDEDLELQRSMPFAVIGSNSTVRTKGRRVRARVYPWGMVDVENPTHSDFALLRKMLMRTHMQNLKDMTHEIHYENYRVSKYC